MDALKADLKDKSKNEKDENEKDGKIKAVPFPLHAFPKQVQDIINDLFRAYQLPIDYYGLSILTVSAGVIGNSYKLYYKRGYTVPANIYGAIVGTSTIGKTPVLKFCLKPVSQIEAAFHIVYKAELMDWKSQIKDEDSNDPRPKRRDLLINDATTESVNEALESNPKGLLLFLDELVAWIKSLNQYRKGSDLEYWLSIWSNSAVKVNRVSKDTLFISKPCISVIGGLQPTVLDELASNGKKDNGFLFRILFAYPDMQKKSYETGKEPSKKTYDEYEKLIKGLHDLHTKPITDEDDKEKTESVNVEQKTESVSVEQKTESVVNLKLSADARKIYVEWYDKNVDLINATKNENTKSLYGKLDNYCLRISLVLELMQSVCEEKTVNPDSTFIQAQTMQNAIALIEYFRWSGMKVFKLIDSDDPLDKLTSEKLEVYEALPKKVKTGEAVKVAEEMGMGGRTFLRTILYNERLFEKVGTGSYHKLY